MESQAGAALDKAALGAVIPGHDVLNEDRHFSDLVAPSWQGLMVFIGTRYNWAQGIEI